MTINRDSYTTDQAAVAEMQPETYVPLSKVKEIVKQIMKDTESLVNDSEDYRIGQWSGAEKVGFAIDCYLSTHPSPRGPVGDKWDAAEQKLRAGLAHRQRGPNNDMWWRDATRERPDYKRLVIAWTKEYGALLADRTTRNPQFGWSCDGTVTHWMPLPDVPLDATLDSQSKEK